MGSSHASGAYCVFMYFVADIKLQGSVLCAKFCPDSPYSLVVGGEKNGFHIINVTNLPQGIVNFYEQLACNSRLIILTISCAEVQGQAADGSRHPSKSSIY